MATIREDADRTHPIQEDMGFQRRSWMVERAGWILLGMLALAALTGVLGLGPLAQARVEASDHSVAVQYERFQRQTRIAQFKFTLAAPAARSVPLRLSAPFQEVYEIASITPAPARSSAGRDGLELEFAAPRDGDLTVVMFAQPRHAGLMRLSAKAQAGSPASFSIFVYP